MFGDVRGTFGERSGNVRGCSGMFGDVRGCSGNVRGCSGVFGDVRGTFGDVRGCSGDVQGIFRGFAVPPMHRLLRLRHILGHPTTHACLLGAVSATHADVALLVLSCCQDVSDSKGGVPVLLSGSLCHIVSVVHAFLTMFAEVALLAVSCCQDVCAVARERLLCMLARKCLTHRQGGLLALCPCLTPLKGALVSHLLRVLLPLSFCHKMSDTWSGRAACSVILPGIVSHLLRCLTHAMRACLVVRRCLVHLQRGMRACPIAKSVSDSPSECQSHIDVALLALSFSHCISGGCVCARVCVYVCVYMRQKSPSLWSSSSLLLPLCFSLTHCIIGCCGCRPSLPTRDRTAGKAHHDLVRRKLFRWQTQRPARIFSYEAMCGHLCWNLKPAFDVDRVGRRRLVCKVDVGSQDNVLVCLQLCLHQANRSRLHVHLSQVPLSPSQSAVILLRAFPVLYANKHKPAGDAFSGLPSSVCEHTQTYT